MTGNNGKRQYHPAFRVMAWAVPLAALALIAVLLTAGGDRGRGRGGGIVVEPPVSADIPYIGFAEIDTVLAGANEAFKKKDYDETARLLTRARFFINSGISEGMFTGMPRNLELVLGLSEFYRGYALKGILFVTAAAAAEPPDETCLWYLGLMHLSQGNRKEAKIWLERTAAIGGVYAERARTALEDM
jgi:hypothetical protein